MRLSAELTLFRADGHLGRGEQFFSLVAGFGIDAGLVSVLSIASCPAEAVASAVTLHR